MALHSIFFYLFLNLGPCRYLMPATIKDACLKKVHLLLSAMSCIYSRDGCGSACGMYGATRQRLLIVIPGPVSTDPPLPTIHPFSDLFQNVPSSRVLYVHISSRQCQWIQTRSFSDQHRSSSVEVTPSR
ncbi:hypothetical protein DL89DRAFT_149753 [Linderina pennispora]|uniref:Secreted protein n=1 Tax=Linderina pennispora TaxID=61395 RepID=A0A1Y1W9Q2_9FUNG|nr:uncharacterized protein DL89DRAFT_149753 [Linderina pennispora]ORX69966.1 hypothetical protein DL89DRAFT_149753 [Linderina pennispora]